MIEYQGFLVNSFSVFIKRKAVKDGHKRKWQSECEATVNLFVYDRERKRTEQYRVSAGDGPVNALDLALKKCLIEYFPFLEGISLTGYKVGILDNKEGTASSVSVHITFSGFGKSWVWEETSTDIISASFNALASGYQTGIDMFSPHSSMHARLSGQND